MLAGCGTTRTTTLPEIGTDFRDYEAELPSRYSRMRMPLEPGLNPGDVVSDEAFIALDRFVQYTEALTTAYNERLAQLEETETERWVLVRAGRMVEQRAELIVAFAEAELNRARFERLVSYGIVGLSFAFLGVGAL